MDHRGWHHPRNLWHCDAPAVVQSITYRLADSLPREVAQRRLDELGPNADAAYRRRIEASLDAGYGCCCLAQPDVAQAIVDTWQRFADERYRLDAWVIMPNHVHVLVTVLGDWPLARIVQSWKSWTGKLLRARYALGWQREYWDRFIRDDLHFRQARAYIEANPVAAGLCGRPGEWPWSSANKAEAS